MPGKAAFPSGVERKAKNSDGLGAIQGETAFVWIVFIIFVTSTGVFTMFFKRRTGTQPDYSGSQLFDDGGCI